MGSESERGKKTGMRDKMGLLAGTVASGSAVGLDGAGDGGTGYWRMVGRRGEHLRRLVGSLCRAGSL